MRQIIMAAIQYALAKNSKERRDTDYNIEGTTVSDMCSLENKALMTAFVYLTEHGIVLRSLMFGGMMVYQDDVPPERLAAVEGGRGQ